MESLGEVPVALVEKGKGPGSHLLSGAMMNPSAMQKLFPDLPEERLAHLRRRSTRTRSTCCRTEAGDPAEADAAAVPQPRQPRDLGRAARPLARASRPRRRASTSSARPPAHKLLVEDGRVVGVRSGDKGRGRDGEELSNFEPGSDLIAKATVLAEGTPGPPHRRGDPPLRARLRGPAAVGARREGGLGGREAARPRDPHDGLAAALRRQVPRVRRLVHLPDGRGQGLDGPRGRARLPRRALLGARRAPGAQGPPAGGEDPRGRQARGLGRQDDPVGRLLGDAAPALGARHGDRAATAPAWSTSRSSRASTTPCTPACSPPRRSTSGSRRAAARRPLQLPGAGRGLGDREGHPPLAQHAPAVRQGLPRRRRDREHDGDLRRPLPGRPLGHPRRRHRGRVHRRSATSTRSPTARRPSTSSRRSSPPATPPATTRPTTSASRRRCRSRSR